MMQATFVKLLIINDIITTENHFVAEVDAA